MSKPKIWITAVSNTFIIQLHCYANMSYSELQWYYNNRSSTQTERITTSYPIFSDEMMIVKYINEALL